MRLRGSALVASLAVALAVGLAVGLAFSLTLACASASAENDADEGGVVRGDRAPVIYRWVDAEGIPHYTADPERVPENVRGQIGAHSGEEAEAPATQPTPRARPRRPERWIATDAPPGAGEEPAFGASLPEAAAEGAGDPGSPEPGAAGSRTAAASPPDPARAAERAALDAEIAALEAQIAEDEEALKDMLSRPAGPGDDMLAVQPEFREIALRLPELQSELRELRERRAQLDGLDGS